MQSGDSLNVGIHGTAETDLHAEVICLQILSAVMKVRISCQDILADADNLVVTF